MEAILRRTRVAAAACMTVAALAITDQTQATDLNGWLREKGHGTAALSYTAEGYDEFWVGTMKVADPGVGKVDTHSVSLWLAYGITDRFSVIATLPYVSADSDGPAGIPRDNLQDAAIVLEYGLLHGGKAIHHSLIVAGGYLTPTTHYQANLPVDIGDGTSDWLGRIVYQLTWRGFYASQQVGYDLRGGEAPDDYPIFTEVGQTLGPVTFSGFYSRLITKSGTDIGDPGFTFPSNREEYTRVGAKVYGRITDRFGLSGMYFTTLDGRNTGDTDGASVGVVISF